MDPNLFKTLGQIAGIGGIALGIVLLIFREVISRTVFTALSPDNAYRLIRLIIVLVFILGIVGLIVWSQGVPPPGPTPPTALLTVSPSSVQTGQSTRLTWQTANATSVSIDNIGLVASNGSQQVTPDSSTTYHLTATGPGGTKEVTAQVTVTAPTLACINGDWHEQSVGQPVQPNSYVWRFTITGVTLSISRDDEFVHGTFAHSDDKWEGDLTWGNGDVWHNVVLTPALDCQSISTNKSWFYKR